MRRKFSREEKLAAIRSFEKGEPAGVNSKMVRRWRDESHKYGANAFSGYGKRRAPIHPKTEPVTFRLTRQEYDQLRVCCSESGARSVSEFARAQLFHSPVEPSARKIEEKVRDLTASVTRLARAIAAT